MDEKTPNRKQRLLDLDRELGRVLARIRRENGVQQQLVAEARGFGRPLVSKIEHGQRSLSAVELPSYAKAIGAKPGQVFDELERIVFEYDSSKCGS